MALNIVKMVERLSETIFGSSKWKQRVKLEHRFIAILAALHIFAKFGKIDDWKELQKAPRDSHKHLLKVNIGEKWAKWPKKGC